MLLGQKGDSLQRCAHSPVRAAGSRSRAGSSSPAPSRWTPRTAGIIHFLLYRRLDFVNGPNVRVVTQQHQPLHSLTRSCAQHNQFISNAACNYLIQPGCSSCTAVSSEPPRLPQGEEGAAATSAPLRCTLGPRKQSGDGAAQRQSGAAPPAARRFASAPPRPNAAPRPAELRPPAPSLSRHRRRATPFPRSPPRFPRLRPFFPRPRPLRAVPALPPLSRGRARCHGGAVREEPAVVRGGRWDGERGAGEEAVRAAPLSSAPRRVEKYRPRALSELVSHRDILSTSECRDPAEGMPGAPRAPSQPLALPESLHPSRLLAPSRTSPCAHLQAPATSPVLPSSHRALEPSKPLCPLPVPCPHQCPVPPPPPCPSNPPCPRSPVTPPVPCPPSPRAPSQATTTFLLPPHCPP